jgi:hypothetical protein
MVRKLCNSWLAHSSHSLEPLHWARWWGVELPPLGNGWRRRLDTALDPPGNSVRWELHHRFLLKHTEPARALRWFYWEPLTVTRMRWC